METFHDQPSQRSQDGQFIRVKSPAQTFRRNRASRRAGDQSNRTEMADVLKRRNFAFWLPPAVMGRFSRKSAIATNCRRVPGRLGRYSRFFVPGSWFFVPTREGLA
jgi:hypothetical protein